MKRELTFFISVLYSVCAFSQVGVNTNNPMSTLDVSVKMNGSTIDNSQIYGLQAPRLTRTELITISGITSKYGVNQKGAIVYITDVSGTDTGGSSAQRLNITTVGYYYFDGNIWEAISASSQEPWYDNGTKSPATTNVQNIYQKGYVGIGYFDATIGTSNGTINRGSLTNAFTIAGTGATNDDMLIESVSNTTSAGLLAFNKARGTYAAKTAVAAGDNIGQLDFSGNGNLLANIRVLAESSTKANLRLSTSGAERLRITGDGDVGIGTVSPVQKLDVSGNIRANSLTNGSNVISGDFGIYNQSGSSLRIAQVPGQPIAFYTDAAGNNTSPFSGNRPTIIFKDNKVGINMLGSANPGNDFEVVSSTAGASGVRLTNLKNASALATNASGDIVSTTIPVSWLVQGTGVTPSSNTNNIYQTGNVSIGTGNPVSGQKLYVVGNSTLTGQLSLTSVANQTIPNTATLKNLVIAEENGRVYAQEIVSYSTKNNSLPDNATLQLDIPNGYYTVYVIGVDECGQRSSSTFKIGGFNTYWALISNVDTTSIFSNRITSPITTLNNPTSFIVRDSNSVACTNSRNFDYDLIIAGGAGASGDTRVTLTNRGGQKLMSLKIVPF